MADLPNHLATHPIIPQIHLPYVVGHTTRWGHHLNTTHPENTKHMSPQHLSYVPLTPERSPGQIAALTNSPQHISPRGVQALTPSTHRLGVRNTAGPGPEVQARGSPPQCISPPRSAGWPLHRSTYDLPTSMHMSSAPQSICLATSKHMSPTPQCCLPVNTAGLAQQVSAPTRAAHMH